MFSLKTMNLSITDRVKTPEGYLGRVVEFDTGFLNVKLWLGNGFKWYTDTELQKI